MKYIKNEKGITLVALVITIMVLLVLAGIGINLGFDSVKKARDTKLASELNMVQHAILETYTKYQVQAQVVEQDLPGTKITDYGQVELKAFEFTDLLKVTSYTENMNNDEYYYELSTASDFKTLGITENEDTYIVNYKTGEVMNITTPKKSDKVLLYVSR